jgi:hypothetical protein
MRTLLAGAIVLSCAVSGSAQGGGSSSRLAEYAEELRRVTFRLADRAVQDVLGSRSNAPGDLHDAVLAQQIHASASLLADMVRGRRPGRELREVTTVLVDLSARAPASARSSLWRSVQDAVADLDRELGRPGGVAPLPPAPRPIVGRVTWRGWVDDRVHLVIKGQSLETRTLSGTPRADGVSAFTSPLPGSTVEVGVEKTSGRGTVAVLQQPSAVNDYTAVVEIYDGSGGAREYRLDIFWR